MVFKEDDYRSHSAALVMATIKRFCMNLLSSNDPGKRRMKHKVMATAIDDNYRAKVLIAG